MSEEPRIEEIRRRVEGFGDSPLGTPLTPNESLEKGLDFAQLTAEDIPYLLKRVEELEAKLAKRDEQIAEMARGGEW